jgi:hypothetical protein
MSLILSKPHVATLCMYMLEGITQIDFSSVVVLESTTCSHFILN